MAGDGGWLTTIFFLLLAVGGILYFVRDRLLPPSGPTYAPYTFDDEVVSKPKRTSKGKSKAKAKANSKSSQKRAHHSHHKARDDMDDEPAPNPPTDGEEALGADISEDTMDGEHAANDPANVEDEPAPAPEELIEESAQVETVDAPQAAVGNRKSPKKPKAEKTKVGIPNEGGSTTAPALTPLQQIIHRELENHQQQLCNINDVKLRQLRGEPLTEEQAAILSSEDEVLRSLCEAKGAMDGAVRAMGNGEVHKLSKDNGTEATTTATLVGQESCTKGEDGEGAIVQVSEAVEAEEEEEDPQCHDEQEELRRQKQRQRRKRRQEKLREEQKAEKQQEEQEPQYVEDEQQNWSQSSRRNRKKQEQEVEPNHAVYVEREVQEHEEDQEYQEEQEEQAEEDGEEEQEDKEEEAEEDEDEDEVDEDEDEMRITKIGATASGTVDTSTEEEETETETAEVDAGVSHEHEAEKGQPQEQEVLVDSNGHGKQEPALEEPAAVASPVAAPVGPPTEREKEIMKLKKKLREIEDLERRQASGQTLAANQLAKLEKKEEVEDKIHSWETMVEPHTIFHSAVVEEVLNPLIGVKVQVEGCASEKMLSAAYMSPPVHCNDLGLISERYAKGKAVQVRVLRSGDTTALTVEDEEARRKEIDRVAAELEKIKQEDDRITQELWDSGKWSETPHKGLVISVKDFGASVRLWGAREIHVRSDDMDSTFVRTDPKSGIKKTDRSAITQGMEVDVRVKYDYYRKDYYIFGQIAPLRPAEKDS